MTSPATCHADVSRKPQKGSTMKNTEKAGGTRFSEGKPGGFWYAPLFGLRLVAEVWQGGSEKYAPLDWQQGQSFSSLFDCMSRHWLAIVMDGVWSRCPDSGAYHMAHLVWNALALLTFMAKERHDLDDMTFWRGATAAQAAAWRKEQGVDSNFDVVAMEREGYRKKLDLGGSPSIRVGDCLPTKPPLDRGVILSS